MQQLICDEKGYIHFRRQTPPSLQKGLPNNFYLFSQKTQLSMKNK